MIADEDRSRGNEAPPPSTTLAFYLVLPVLLIVGALIAYKSSAALAVIGKVSATGAFTPRGNIIPRVGASDAGVLARTLGYFLVIWPALVFGILISAAISTFVSPQWLSRGTKAPLLPTRKSRSAPLSACSTWSKYRRQ